MECTPPINEKTKNFYDEDYSEEDEPWGKLISLNTEEKFKIIELEKDKTTFGRHPTADYVFENIKISALHCKIIREEQYDQQKTKLFIKDLSTNGTFINDGETPIGKNKKIELQHNDIISLSKGKNIYKQISFKFQKYVIPDDSEDDYEDFPEGYKIVRELGRGTFSVVKLATNNNQKFAVKIITKKTNAEKEKLSELQKREVSILKQINHPNIVSIYDFIDTKDNVFIVMEYAKYGDLYDSITANQYLSTEKAKNIITKILNGVNYLHGNTIVHRDLKPENILLGKNDEDVKIADFGFSRIVPDHEKMKTMCGTIEYCAPEITLNDLLYKIKNGEGYGKEVDLWSIGAILYTMICGYGPKTVIKGQIDTLDKCGLFPIHDWQNIDNSICDLITNLLKKNPSERYTVDQALNHPWITGQEFKKNTSNISSNYEKVKQSREYLSKFKMAVDIGNTTFDNKKKENQNQNQNQNNENPKKRKHQNNGTVQQLKKRKYSFL